MKWLKHGWSGEKKRDMFIWASWPREFTLSATASFPQDFPELQPHFCANEISDATRDYNCIAWAASETNVRWEPDPLFQYFWPDRVPREYTVNAFIAAYQTLGFQVCENGDPEIGFEKIVLFSRAGFPTHAARRLGTGTWTSKLGDFEDIEHINLQCLRGPLYGTPTTYLKRPV